MRTFNVTFTAIVAACLGSLNLNAQLPNGGFETWIPDGSGNLNPEFWETINDSPNVCVEQYTPAYAGNFSMKVAAFNPGIVVPGMAMANFPLSVAPTEVTMCLKATVMPGDQIFVIASMWRNDTIIASPDSCTFRIQSSITNWTCLSFPIAYHRGPIPDSALIQIIAGDYLNAQVGTEIMIDDIDFGFTSGMIDNFQSAFVGSAYPNPTSEYVTVPISLTSESDVNATVFDACGKEAMAISYGRMSVGEHSIGLVLGDLPRGVYYAAITGHDFSAVRKVVVNK